MLLTGIGKQLFILTGYILLRSWPIFATFGDNFAVILLILQFFYFFANFPATLALDNFPQTLSKKDRRFYPFSLVNPANIRMYLFCIKIS